MSDKSDHLDNVPQPKSLNEARRAAILRPGKQYTHAVAQMIVSANHIPDRGEKMLCRTQAIQPASIRNGKPTSRSASLQPMKVAGVEAVPNRYTSVSHEGILFHQ